MTEVSRATTTAAMARHPAEQLLRKLPVLQPRRTRLARRLRGDAAYFLCGKPSRLFQLGTLRGGADHPARGPIHGGSACLRRYLRRDRPFLPGDDGLCVAWIFAYVVQAGFDPFLAIAAALLVGSLLGFGVGALVVYAGLSSLMATLGMNFMLRGLILIITKAKSIAAPQLRDSLAFKITSTQIWGIPLQIVWAIAFVIFCALLYNRHRFGAQVHVVGDNPDSANEMGINVKLVRVKVFAFMGVGAALAGVFSTMINFTWWPTSGDGYLLPVIASVFVGGTPPWGGIGTVLGGAIGALTVSFIQTGVVWASD